MNSIAERDDRRFGLLSGISLVVSNMVGAGVFLSEGFMAQKMGPGAILLAWVVGALIALAGTRVYGQVVTWIPRSGGEYRFLSELLHPALGYLAGWASLLVGFSAPIAVNALAAGAFVATIVPGINERAFGIGVVLCLAGGHALGLRTSKGMHNAFALSVALLLAGFVGIGLTLGQNRWPTWTPPDQTGGFPASAFAESLFYVAFAFSGWNAATYAASEFRNAPRDVPRAMTVGCAAVAALYLVINWVFVTNLTPEDGRAVFQYETTRVTLGHLVVARLVGSAGATAMSILCIVAFVASASAMTLVGPRVYAAMAEDGFLPRALARRNGAPPRVSVFVQCVLAVLLLVTQGIQQILVNAGAILTLFAALVSVAIFKEALRPTVRPRARTLTLVCAALHLLSSAWMLYFGLRGTSLLSLWIVAIGSGALAAYGIARMSSATRRPTAVEPGSVR